MSPGTLLSSYPPCIFETDSLTEIQDWQIRLNCLATQPQESYCLYHPGTGVRNLSVHRTQVSMPACSALSELSPQSSCEEVAPSLLQMYVVFIHVCACSWVCVCVHTHACIHIHISAKASQKLLGVNLFLLFEVWSLTQSRSSAIWIVSLNSLAPIVSCLCVPGPGNTGRPPCLPRIHVGSNLAPHTCLASALPTELSFEP